MGGDARPGSQGGRLASVCHRHTQMQTCKYMHKSRIKILLHSRALLPSPPGPAACPCPAARHAARRGPPPQLLHPRVQGGAAHLHRQLQREMGVGRKGTGVRDGRAGELVAYLPCVPCTSEACLYVRARTCTCEYVSMGACVWEPPQLCVHAHMSAFTQALSVTLPVGGTDGCAAHSLHARTLF